MQRILDQFRVRTDDGRVFEVIKTAETIPSARAGASKGDHVVTLRTRSGLRVSAHPDGGVLIHSRLEPIYAVRV